MYLDWFDMVKPVDNILSTVVLAFQMDVPKVVVGKTEVEVALTCCKDYACCVYSLSMTQLLIEVLKWMSYYFRR